MFWQQDACYRIHYGQEHSITFRINGKTHLVPSYDIRIKDLRTGKECLLFDLLLTAWTGFEKIQCPEHVEEPTQEEAAR